MYTHIQKFILKLPEMIAIIENELEIAKFLVCYKEPKNIVNYSSKSD